MLFCHIYVFFIHFLPERKREIRTIRKKRFVWFEICLIAPFSLIAFKQTIRQFFFCFSFISANITTLTITLKQKEDSTNLSNCSWMNSFKNCWILLSFYNYPLAMLPIIWTTVSFSKDNKCWTDRDDIEDSRFFWLTSVQSSRRDFGYNIISINTILRRIHLE